MLLDWKENTIDMLVNCRPANKTAVEISRPLMMVLNNSMKIKY